MTWWGYLPYSTVCFFSAYQLPIGYLIVLYVGQRVMKERNPVKLDYILILWNLSLAVFSIVGTVGIIPDFISTLENVGFVGSFCQTGRYYEGYNGYWVYLFMISKVFELGKSSFKMSCCNMGKSNIEATV